MKRAALLLLCLLALAGCGRVSEVREPDMFAGEGIKPAPAAPKSVPRGDGGAVRIVVVTHGQASSAFWAIVKNGVDAAARQMDVSVSYRSPDTFSVVRMKELINEAVDQQPDGLVVSIPSPAVGPPIRRALRSGIPVVSINSGADVFRSFGILAHVGQPEEKAGFAAGERLAQVGVRRALCVNQEVGNQGLDERCRGFARAIRAAGGTSKVFALNIENRTLAAPKLSAAIEQRKADGVLVLNAGGALAALDAKKEGGRAVAVKLGAFDLAPEVLEAVKDGRVEFAVDQQAYLQGYLPVVMLTQQARYGLLPAQGEVVPTGPNFVTRGTAELALQLSARGIR